MKSKTLSLLALSGVIMIATILTSAYWDEMGLGENKIPLAVTTIIAFVSGHALYSYLLGGIIYQQ